MGIQKSREMPKETLDHPEQPAVLGPDMVFWAIVPPPEGYKYPPLGALAPEEDSPYGFRVVHGRKELDDILAKHPKTLWQDRYNMSETFIGRDSRPVGMSLPNPV